MPDEPRYRFSGRARELKTIERALLRGKVVMWHGFGGYIPWRRDKKGVTLRGKAAKKALQESRFHASPQSGKEGSSGVTLRGKGPFLTVPLYVGCPETAPDYGDNFGSRGQV